MVRDITVLGSIELIPRMRRSRVVREGKATRLGMSWSECIPGNVGTIRGNLEKSRDAGFILSGSSDSHGRRISPLDLFDEDKLTAVSELIVALSMDGLGELLGLSKPPSSG